MTLSSDRDGRGQRQTDANDTMKSFFRSLSSSRSLCLSILVFAHPFLRPSVRPSVRVCPFVNRGSDHVMGIRLKMKRERERERERENRRILMTEVKRPFFLSIGRAGFQ